MKADNTLKVDDAVFFYDTIYKDKPYIASMPRNHESLFFVKKGTLLYEKKIYNSKHLKTNYYQNQISNDMSKDLITQGQIGYIAKGSIDKSSAYKCSEVSYIAVNFSFDLTNPKPKQPLFPNALCSEVRLYNLENLFESALKYYNSSLPGSKMIYTGILYQIIGMLINNQNLKRLTSNKAKRIEKSMEYIENNFCDSDLKISTLGMLSNMSEKQFRRLFAELYEKNPHRFLTELRLNKAKSLLLNTSASISDIAAKCGFSDLYSFSHCFKKNFGVSPKTYKDTIK